jgi:hypothetical protein
MNKFLFHGVIAGVLAAVANVIYLNMYNGALATDFSKVVGTGAVIGASIFGCMLMAIGYYLLVRLGYEKQVVWLNMLIAVLSFASILGAFGITLPTDIESPELLPGLVVPMHFIPALAFFCIAPVFVVRK